MIAIHTLLSFFVLVSLYLIENLSVLSSRGIYKSDPVSKPLYQQLSVVVSILFADAHDISTQVLHCDSVQSEDSDAVASQSLMSAQLAPSVDIGMISAHHVSVPLLSALETDKGMAFARELGVLLFCVPNIDTATAFAPELGVVCVPDMDTDSVFARELGVVCVPNMDADSVFARELSVLLSCAPDMNAAAVFVSGLDDLLSVLKTNAVLPKGQKTQ